MKFFSRKGPENPTVPVTTPSSGPGKGRPTPSRKEAEAQRKQTLHVPADPKAARKAARIRATEERKANREAMMAGDERALPRRDAGPVKKYVRDYVDGRWAAGELFMPIAIFVLLSGFLPWTSWGMPNAQGYISTLWLFVTFFIIVDTTILVLRMKGQLKAKWPADADRKGVGMYAVTRVLQLRRLRLPPPRVRRNGTPLPPRQKKPA